MERYSRRLRPWGVLQKTLALWLSATVLMLTALAVSPAAHEQLHGHDATAPDHACAITLYAQGVTPALAYVQVVAPAAWLISETTPAPDEVQLVAPRYLLRPLRGPPVELS